jgi:hypothetical protein
MAKWPFIPCRSAKDAGLNCEARKKDGNSACGEVSTAARRQLCSYSRAATAWVELSPAFLIFTIAMGVTDLAGLMGVQDEDPAKSLV